MTKQIHTMSLYKVADGILSSDHARSTLEDEDAIVNYAEFAGSDINYDDARRIQRVALAFLARLEAGEIPTTNERFYELERPLDDEAL